MNNKLEITMEQVLDAVALDYKIPVLTLDQLTLLGQRAVHAQRLTHLARTITMVELFQCMKDFISTPFGAKVLREIQQL